LTSLCLDQSATLLTMSWFVGELSGYPTCHTVSSSLSDFGRVTVATHVLVTVQTSFATPDMLLIQ